jgi:arginase
MKSHAPIRLIGAPTDIGAGSRGASMGPEAMRVAGLAEALTARGLHVRDDGNLAGPPNPWQPPSHALHGGEFPMLLGGDHCLAIGSITAIAAHCRRTKKRLKVLWLDAHADFNTSAITPSGNIHGMPVATLFGFGAAALVNLSDPSPALHKSEIVQIGIRSVDEAEKRFVHEHGLEVFDMRSIDELGMRTVMQQALTDVDDNTHLHVSFDVDFLDPAIAPGVGTTVDGGPTYREAQLCMEMIADTGRLASLDVMELNPALDVKNATASLAVDLIESLFGKSTLMRQT